MAIFKDTSKLDRSPRRAWSVLSIILLCSAIYDRNPGQPTVTGHRSNLTLAAKEDTSDVMIRVYLDSVDQVGIAGPKSELDIWISPEKKILTLGRGKKCVIHRQDGAWRFTRFGGVDVLPVDTAAGTGTIECQANNGFPVDVIQESSHRYPGRLKLVALDDNRFAIVNVVDIETYLTGVVGAEMYSHWHTSALRAQSIACRTYALYQKAVDGSDRQWDIGSNQGSQMYLGLDRQHRRVRSAVEDTRGIVLAFGPQGQEKIFPAYYSAICGGHTEDAFWVFGQSLEPLSGSRCPYCASVAQPEYYRWSGVRLDKRIVNSRLMERYPQLKKLDQIVEIQVVTQSSYGRAERIRLIGINGRRATLRAEDFRLTVSSSAVPLRSSWYVLCDGGDCWIFDDGHGWGHGVGLCQCGAEQMARLGKDCVEILEHYYPKAVLVRAY